MPKAQVSIEFILLLAASLAFISGIAAALSSLNDSALLAIDAQGAKSLSSEISSSARTLSLLGNGSEKKLPYSALGNWRISQNAGKAYVLVGNGAGNVEIELHGIVVAGGMELKRKGFLVLRKEGGKILLQNG